MYDPPCFLAVVAIEMRIIKVMDNRNLPLHIVDSSRSRFNLPIEYSFQKARAKGVPLAARQSH